MTPQDHGDAFGPRSHPSDRAGQAAVSPPDGASIPIAGPYCDPEFHNPISRVMFRAGLLVCRETMARFVEQGGDAVTAASIRANWWPRLGPDPGAPRLLDFNEITDCTNAECIEKACGVECIGGWVAAAGLTPSIEALPVALQFLNFAQGIDARSGETRAAGLGPKDECPVAEGDAP